MKDAVSCKSTFLIQKTAQTNMTCTKLEIWTLLLLNY